MNREEMINSVREALKRYQVTEYGFNTLKFNEKNSEREEISRLELNNTNSTKLKTCMTINCSISNKFEIFLSKMNQYEEISIDNAVIKRGNFIMDQFYDVEFIRPAITAIFINCRFDHSSFERTIFNNCVFFGCEFEEVRCSKTVFKNTYFIGCSKDSLIDEGENDFKDTYSLLVSDVLSNEEIENGTIHFSADIDEEDTKKILEDSEETQLLEETENLTNEEKANMFEDNMETENENHVLRFKQTTLDDYDDVENQEVQESQEPEKEEIEVTEEQEEIKENVEVEENKEETNEGEKTMEQTEAKETITVLNEKAFTQEDLERDFSLKDKRFTSCTFENLKISTYLPTGIPFVECKFENVVFDVNIANLQFKECSFENVIFNKTVKNVLFEDCDIKFQTEQSQEVFQACSYIMNDENKKDEHVENMICGEPREKELTAEQKQQMIKEEVEKQLSEKLEEAKKEAFEEGKKEAEKEFQDKEPSVGEFIKSLEQLATFTADVVQKADALVDKEADKHKVVKEEVVRELTEEEQKTLVIKYIHEHNLELGALITAAQTYDLAKKKEGAPEEAKEETAKDKIEEGEENQKQTSFTPLG